MSGKKGKKTKGKTMNLHDFLEDTPGVPSMPKINNWADSTEDDDYGYSSRNKEPVVLPTAPRAARDQSMIDDTVPKEPPYVAYISNLPYDVDETDIAEFFQDMNVESMRLPKDASKFKGYGYVIFEDRQSLIDALSMVDTTLKSRRVRIEVSTNSNDDRRGGGRMGRMGDQRRDYSDDPERTTGDWRTRGGDDGPPMNDEPRREDRYRSRGGYGDRDRRDDRDNGMEDKPGNWRDAPRPEMSADRPRRDDRGGAGAGGGERDWNRFADRGRGGPRDGSNDRNGMDRGGGGAGGGGFGPRRNFNDDADKDRERWSSIRSQTRDNLEGSAPEPPKTRPTLNLQPRTKPIDPVAVAKSDDEKEDDSTKEKDTTEESESAPVDPPKPAANIFGAAKPVDTAAREREIMERLENLATSEAKKEEEKKSEERSAPKEGAWGRRNGEGSRFDSDKNARPAWRSRTNDQKDGRDGDKRDFRDSREPRENREGVRSIETKSSRSAVPPARGPPKQIDTKASQEVTGEPKKEKEEKEIDISKMPKARDDQAPNFVASNKYSMLPDDVDPDNIED